MRRRVKVILDYDKLFFYESEKSINPEKELSDFVKNELEYYINNQRITGGTWFFIMMEISGQSLTIKVS